jgi:23S rRNA (adenine2503-C2)-methyltransferase
MIDPRNATPEESMARLAELGADASTARRLLATLIGRGIHNPAEWEAQYRIPKRVSRAIGELPRLKLESRLVSPRDRFEKLRFGTADGMAIETVLIPLHREGAVSVCLSSQIGCVMGCAYCATARMSRRRNLETWEILDQFLQARAIASSQGRRVSGAVFMGMGEPFLNYDRVLAAADMLRCPYGAAVRGQAITISTVGLVAEIDRYTKERRPFRLSISLGAATDEKRARLVPVASRTPIAEVMAAARRHAEDRRDRVMLAYVCVGGFNVGEDDARALADLVGDTRIRLDLIDVTDPTGTWRPPSPAELKAFRDALTRHLGQPVVRRYSGGADILAACGTLAGADLSDSQHVPVNHLTQIGLGLGNGVAIGAENNESA